MRPQLVGASLALVLAAAASAAAMVIVPAEAGELAREASAIVHGRVVAVRGVWTPGRRNIETVVTLEVSEALKGQPGREVSFRVPGGELGRYRSVMPGAPVFREGQELVVFLGARAPALPYLLGLGQGVYRVRREPGSGRALVVPPLPVGNRTQAVKVQRGDPARIPLSLEEFTRQVRSAMSGVAGREGSRDRRRPAAGKEPR